MHLLFSLYWYLIFVAQSPPLLKIKEQVLSSQDSISYLPTKISVSTHNFAVSTADCYLQNCQSPAMLPA